MSQIKTTGPIPLAMDNKNFTMGLLLSCALLTGRTQPPANIADLPKVELHLHLDCSLSYEVVHQLDPTITRETYRQQFIAPAVCTNLAGYISRADNAVALMQTQHALRL